MKEKENAFVITMILFPFILLLAIFRFIHFLKSNIYDYIIFFLSFLFLFYFIETLFFMLDEIIHSNNKKRVILVILIPIIYIPIYYLQNITSSDKYLSYSLFVLNILSIICFYFSLKNILTDYIVLEGKNEFILRDTFDYVSKDNIFSIKIDSNYRCDNNLEGYSIACENNNNDSFIGFYTYQDENFNQGKLDDILSFHFEEILEVIKESNYDSNIEYLDNCVKINYNNMAVLLTQRNYFFPDKGYSLIILMEIKNNEDNIKDFENVIESIQFLN